MAWWIWLLTSLAVAVEPVVRDPVARDPVARDPAAYEAGQDAALAAVAPDAVAGWHAANEARDAGQLEKASAGYAAVSDAAPTFDGAWRRRCRVELELGHRDVAVGLCRHAVDVAPDAPEDVATLALALTGLPGDEGPADDVREAASLATKALRTSPDADVARIVAPVALAAGDAALLDDAAKILVDEAPDDEVSWFYRAVDAAGTGDADAARDALDRARALGLPEDQAAAIEETLPPPTPGPQRWAAPFAAALGAWGALLLGALGLAAVGRGPRALAVAFAVGAVTIAVLATAVAGLAIAVVVALFQAQSVPMTAAMALSVLALGFAVASLRTAAAWPPIGRPPEERRAWLAARVERGGRIGRWTNPVWWYLAAFERVYARLSV